MTMQDDVANRERDLKWPERFNPISSDMFVHNSLLINAKPEKIWSHIIDATKWPEWYPNSKDVVLLGGAKELSDGVRWRWSTFGITGESWVTEFAPFRQISWSGDGPDGDISFYHTWYLKPSGSACMVVTDEAAVGEGAAKLKQADESLMHRGHDLWLATLQWVSESK